MNNCSPGDVLMLTAAVRDLHKAHPGQYVTGGEVAAPPVAGERLGASARAPGAHRPAASATTAEPTNTRFIPVPGGRPRVRSTGALAAAVVYTRREAIASRVSGWVGRAGWRSP